MPMPFDLSNQQPAATNMPLPGQQQQQPTQPQSPVRQANSWVDQIFSPISKPVGGFLGDVAGGITHYIAPKYEDQVRQEVTGVGETLPRTAAEAFLISKGGWKLPAAGFGDVALKSFGETDPNASMGQKLASTGLNAAAFAAAPMVGGGLGRTAAQKMVPGSAFANRVGSITGTLGAFEGVNALNAKILGQQYDPFTVKHLAGTIASTLPWEAGQMWYEHMAAKNQEVKQQQDTQLTQARQSTAQLPAVPNPKNAAAQPMWTEVPEGEPLPPDRLHDQGPLLRGTFVLDSTGRPKQVFHATKSEFDEFDPSLGEGGSHFGTAAQANAMLGDKDSGLNSVYNVRGEVIGNPRIYNAYLNIKNPVYLPDFMLWNDLDLMPYLKNKLSPETWAQWENRLDQIEHAMRAEGVWDNSKTRIQNLQGNYFDYGDGNNVFQDYLKKNGYDGIIYNNRYEATERHVAGEKSYIVFDKKQIVPGYKGADAKFDDATKQTLSKLDEAGHSADIQNNVAQALKSLPRLPNESYLDYFTRAVLNVDPRINEPGNANTLMQTAHDYFSRLYRDILQLPGDDTQRLLKTTMRLVAMVGHSQPTTKVVTALPFTNAKGETQAANFYAPSRSGVANAVIGVLPQSLNRGDRAILESMHAFAHEAFHGMVLQATGDTFGQLPAEQRQAVRNLINTVKDLSQEEMTQGIQTLLSTMATPMHKDLFDFRNQFYTPDAAGRMEYLADMYGLVAMGAAAPNNTRPFRGIADLIKFGHQDLRDLSRGLFRDFMTALPFLKEFAQKVFKWQPSAVDKLQTLHDNMRKMMQSVDQADAAAEAFMRIQQTKEAKPWEPIAPIDYARMDQLVKKFGGDPFDKDLEALVKEVSPMIVPQKDKELPEPLGVRLKPYDYFTAISQIGRRIPELADMAWLGRNYGTMARELVNTTADFFKSPTTNKINTDMMANMVKEGTPLNKAWSAITLKQNELDGARDGQRLRQDEIKSMPAYSKLNAQEKAFIDEHLDHWSAAALYNAKKMYDSFRNRVGHKLAQVWQTHDHGLTWDKAEQLGQALATCQLDNDIYEKGPQVDEVLWRNKAKAQALLQEYIVGGQLQAATAQRLSEIFTMDENGKLLQKGQMSKVQESLLNYRNQLLGPLEQDKTGWWGFRGRPGYSPEVRLGRWTLAWQAKDPTSGKASGQQYFVGFKDEQSFRAKYAQLVAQQNRGELLYLKPHDKTDSMDQYAGLSPDKFQAYNDAVEALNNKVLAKVSRAHGGMYDNIVNEIRDELKPGSALVAMLESPHMKQQRLMGGREDLNMAEGMIHYINNTAYTIAKRYEVGQHQLFLNDPKMRDNPQLQKTARAYFREIVDPTERGYGFLKKMIAFNYIFFSPSLAFVELTQQATNHVPALCMAGMGVGDAWKATAKANFDMANAWKAGKDQKLNYHVYDNVDDTRAVQDAVKKGIIDAGWLQEFWQLEHDLPFINKQRLFGRLGDMFDRTQLLGNAMHQMYRLGTNMHGMAITINTETAFLSAFRHFKSQGMSYDEAFRQADDLSRESMHGGGRASRPLWFLGIGPGSPGATVGGLMYSLQMYLYNTTAQMAHYLSSAIKNTAKNPTEITAAHKAAAGILGAQLVLGGVMGLPITSQMMALVEQAFPNTEPRRRLRELFFGAGKWVNSKTHLVGQDEELGHFVSTAATDGLMNAVAPWNIGNRFELGVLMGVDPFRGFDWKNVIGPGGQLLEQILLKPAQEFSKGHYGLAGVQMLPNSNLRRVAEQAVNGWQLRNGDQRLNLQLSGAERTLLAMGFTPKRVAEWRQLNEMKTRAEDVHSLEQRKFHNELATKWMAGQHEEVQQALLERAHTMLNYDPRAGAQQVAELVQQRTIPFDPLRAGSRTSQAYMTGRLFDRPDLLRQGQPTETERALQKSQLATEIGFPARITHGEMKVASIVDQLMLMYPSMSREEALTVSARMLNPRLGMYAPLDQGMQTLNPWAMGAQSGARQR